MEWGTSIDVAIVPPTQAGGHPKGDLRAAVALDHRDAVLTLQVEPELRSVAKVAAQTHCRISGDRTPAVQNVRDPARRHAEVERHATWRLCRGPRARVSEAVPGVRS